MTTTQTISRERLEDLKRRISMWGHGAGYTPEEVYALIENALTAMDSEPVAYIFKHPSGRLFWSLIDESAKNHKDVFPVYTHTAPSIQEAPVLPDGLRLALSNAGIAAPESDEILAATSEKYVQLLVDWVKDRRPFAPEPVAVPDLSRLEAVLEWIEGLPVPTKAATVNYSRLKNFITDCRAAMQAEPVTAATVLDGWIAEAKKLAEIYGTSFVVFRNGEEPECADPSKVIISFTDAGLGYPAAPEQEV